MDNNKLFKELENIAAQYDIADPALSSVLYAVLGAIKGDKTLFLTQELLQMAIATRAQQN